MASYLVTGANRGLGLGFVKTLAARPVSEVSIIYAAIRNETEELQQIVASSNGRVKPINVTVTDEESVVKAASTVEQSLGEKGLDVLINNVGVFTFAPEGIQTMGNLEDDFRTNVMSAHYVTSAFVPLLKKGNLKKVVNISTTLGSITMAPTFSFSAAPAYKITKAALNMMTVQYAQEFAKDGFTCIAVSPGWVKTDLGTDGADITTEVAGPAVLDVVSRASKTDTGKFFNIHVPGYENAPGPNQYDGKEVPW